MQIEVIETPELGDRSYLIHDGDQAVVIDPQRDTERVTALARRLGVRIALVAETHIHNDYVTGGYALARAAAARYAVNSADDVGFARLGVRDADELDCGSLVITVIATPGHTPTHLAYAITDRAAPGLPPAVFTGGSLLLGSVGRTDLISPDLTRELARASTGRPGGWRASCPGRPPFIPLMASAASARPAPRPAGRAAPSTPSAPATTR